MVFANTLFLGLSLGCGVVTMPDLDPDGMAPDGMFSDGTSDSASFDAGMSGSDAVDSAITSRCPVPGEFSLSWDAPVKIPISTASLEYSPTISCDDKELYFHRLNGEHFDIYMARRSTPGAPWAAATAIGFGIGSERDPEIGPEFPGRTELYYTRDQIIHVARRSDPDMPWSESGDESDELFGGSSPALSGDGLTLYYIHEYQLERRRRASPDDPWGSAEIIPMPFRYQQVTVSADGSAFLVSLPLESAAARVQARRVPGEWVAVPELDSMKSCDFTWQGDLLCSDSMDLYYVPNRQL